MTAFVYPTPLSSSHHPPSLLDSLCTPPPPLSLSLPWTSLPSPFHPQVLLVLLEKISRTDRFKEEICREGGVQVLVDSVANFILYEELVSRCLGYVYSAGTALNLQPLGGSVGCELIMRVLAASRCGALCVWCQRVLFCLTTHVCVRGE